MEYEIIKRLGGGAFGNVYQVKDENSATWALKQMDDKDDWKHEVLILKMTTHMDHVLRMKREFISTIGKSKSYFIVLEFFEGGNLESAVQKLGQRRYNDNTDNTCIALKWMYDVMTGLKEMHQANIAHHDIKGGNIIIKDDNTAVLGDLGLGQVFSESEIETAKSASLPGSLWKKRRLGPAIGTRYYMPPEEALYYPLNSKDMWAFGQTVLGDVLSTWLPQRGGEVMTLLVEKTIKNSRFRDSLCLHTLGRIPMMTLVSINDRPSDDEMLEFIKFGLDANAMMKELFSHILDRGAVMLGGVSKKQSGMFHFRDERDFLIAPRLAEVIYDGMYQCEETEFEKDLPYVVWKSREFLGIYESKWRCYAVQAVSKNKDGSITLQTTVNVNYNIRVSRAECVKGSCENTIGNNNEQKADKLVASFNSWIPDDGNFDSANYWYPYTDDEVSMSSDPSYYKSSSIRSK